MIAQAGSFAPSALVVLLAPVGAGQPANSIKEAFGAATGLPHQLIGSSPDFVVVMRQSLSTDVMRDPSTGITGIVHGDVYPDSECGRGRGGQVVLAAYKEQDIMRAARAINGSYAALIVTPNDVSVVIHCVGSRKVFFSEDDREFWISKTLALHPRGKADTAGVASLIINRLRYEGKTLFRNGRMLARATVHVITCRKPASSTYWQYGFADARAKAFNYGLEERKQDLGSLIQPAVYCRMLRAGKSWCSLTGGIDSRTIVFDQARNASWARRAIRTLKGKRPLAPSGEAVVRRLRIGLGFDREKAAR